jgi:hypothetical protein
MSSVIHRIAAFLAVMVLCTVARAQAAEPQAAAPEVTLKSLRALSEQMPKSADTEDELGSIGTLTNEIVAQADRFVAARTVQLADLNARLGELGPAPAAGGNAENPDVTRQRAALELERNALDADIRLARLISVNAQQRRSEVLAQRRAVFEAQLLRRFDSPLRAAFWDQARAQWKTDQARLRTLAGEFESGFATALHGRAPVTPADRRPERARPSWQSASGWPKAASPASWRSTVPVGRLRRSLLALLTVLAYILIAGLALSLGLGLVGGCRPPGTQSTRLGRVDGELRHVPGFVIGLGRSLLANGRSSWRPAADRGRPGATAGAAALALCVRGAWSPGCRSRSTTCSRPAQRRDQQPGAHRRIRRRRRHRSVPPSASAPGAAQRSPVARCPSGRTSPSNDRRGSGC